MVSRRGGWTARPQLTSDAYDSKRGVTVLFGGFNGQATLSDTWEWDHDARQVQGAAPPARALHAMTYDGTRGRVVLFGGTATVDGNTASQLGDTWEYDGTAWQRVATIGPPRRDHASMAFDVSRGRTVLFGGSVGDPPSADTWEWNGTTWTPVTASTSPQARAGHVMVYSPALQQTLLYGGFAGSSPTTELWSFDGARWARR